jgi:hypothetical protein
VVCILLSPFKPAKGTRIYLLTALIDDFDGAFWNESPGAIYPINMFIIIHEKIFFSNTSDLQGAFHKSGQDVCQKIRELFVVFGRSRAAAKHQFSSLSGRYCYQVGMHPTPRLSGCIRHYRSMCEVVWGGDTSSHHTFWRITSTKK